MHAKHLDWKIKSYFESTPALEWSYLDFLKSLRPYCVSGEHSLDDQQSIWRKRYLTFLSNVLEEEQDYDIKERVTFLLRQVSQISSYYTLSLNRQGEICAT